MYNRYKIEGSGPGVKLFRLNKLKLLIMWY
jgi:hypothetical protein